MFGSPEKDWLLQQELYSAILSGHCSLIIEIVLEVIPLSFGFSSRVFVWTTTSSTTNQLTFTRHIIIFIISRLLTTMLTLILASQLLCRTTQVMTTSLAVSGGNSIVVNITLNLETRMPKAFSTTLLALDIL